MALSCDLRICGKSGVDPSKINLTVRNFSFYFFNYVFPEFRRGCCVEYARNGACHHTWVCIKFVFSKML